MPAREILKNVLAVGAIDWNRRTFDELVSLPHGTSYNAYLVKGTEKTALIDTVDPAFSGELLQNLADAGTKRIDYIISNHAEQDHSGTIPLLLERYPGARVVTNAKCAGFLSDLLGVASEQFLEIKNGETLSLGGRTLSFINAPWVHWPETMFTFLEEEKLLFSCDLFGSHLASGELFARDRALVYREAKRYYAQIMMPYARSIAKYVKQVRELQPAMIAPSHGPVYERPEFILQAQEEWVGAGEKNRVLIFYISMHGSTKQMAHHLCGELLRRDVPVELFDVAEADIGEMAMALPDAGTLVLASPAFLVGPHPKMAYWAMLINALKPPATRAAIIGSFGWGNKLEAQLKELLGGLKLDFFESVLSKGLPGAETEKQLEELANQIEAAHSNMNL